MPKTETDIEKRNKYGMLCGIVGIFLNLILFAGKLFAGMFSGAISITADAFNNLSDAGSSIITIAGFKMAVPVSWQIGRTPLAETSALRSIVKATYLSLSEDSGSFRIFATHSL